MARRLATHRPGSQLQISLQSSKDAVLSDDEDSVRSYDVTDTVSIPDQETLNKGTEEQLVTDRQHQMNEMSMTLMIF